MYKFSKKHSFHSYVMSSRMDTVLCRTMILTSRRARALFEDDGVHWWKTPAESSDANPIENLWHELKEFIRREVEPHNKAELVQGRLLVYSRPY